MQSTSSDKLLPYYKIPRFVKWIEEEKFVKISPQNVNNYFAIFQHREMCRKKECFACSGLQPIYDLEDDIIKGNIHHLKCLILAQESRNLLARKMLSDAKIPPAFKDIEIEDLTTIDREDLLKIEEHVNCYVKNFPEEKPNGLYIYSEKHGVGKTSVAWVVVKHLLKNLKLIREFMFYTTTMFMDRLQIDSLTAEHYFFHKSCTCGLLILDDFGHEKRTPIIEKVRTVLEERAWNLRPVIIVSSIPPDKWAWEGTPDESLMIKIKKVTRVLYLDPQKSEEKDESKK